MGRGKETKTRRVGVGAAVLLLAVLAGLTQVAARARAQAGPPAPKSFALRHSVVVIGPNSPMFDTLLERWFPGVTDVNYFQQIRPLLAIVHNNTLRAIKAYVVKWTITNADGSTNTTLLPVMQEPLDAWELTGTRTVLGPAGAGRGTELVSPYFGWTRKAFGELKPARFVSIPFSSAAREPLVGADRAPGQDAVLLLRRRPKARPAIWDRRALGLGR